MQENSRYINFGSINTSSDQGLNEEIDMYIKPITILDDAVAI